MVNNLEINYKKRELELEKPDPAQRDQLLFYKLRSSEVENELLHCFRNSRPSFKYLVFKVMLGIEVIWGHSLDLSQEAQTFSAYGSRTDIKWKCCWWWEKGRFYWKALDYVAIRANKEYTLFKYKRKANYLIKSTARLLAWELRK